MFKEKDRFHKEYKQYAKSRDFITFSFLRGRRKDDLVNCLRLYVIHTKQNLTKDIQEFWRFTKSKKVINNYADQLFYEGQSAEGGEDIANMFSKIFSSVI